MAPGSPLDALLADPNINPAEIERRRIELGLDNPVLIQYFTWLKEFFQGNLGYSFKTQRAVAAMIRHGVEWRTNAARGAVRDVCDLLLSASAH